MSLPLIITPEAEEDLAEAKAWYERKREGLGDEFVLCVEEALDRIRRLRSQPPRFIRGSGEWWSGAFPMGSSIESIPIRSPSLPSITAGAIEGLANAGLTSSFRQVSAGGGEREAMTAPAEPFPQRESHDTTIDGDH